MKITATKIAGAYPVKHEPFADERGTFPQMFCRRELEEAGLCGDIAEMNLSTNQAKAQCGDSILIWQGGRQAGTCVQGVVFDICVDVRESSPTYGENRSAKHFQRRMGLVCMFRKAAHMGI